MMNINLVIPMPKTISQKEIAYDGIVMHVRIIKLALVLDVQEIYLANTKIGTPSSDPFSDRKPNRKQKA
jgi:hypothetical protein